VPTKLARKIAAAKKRGRGGNSFPPNPLSLPAPPERNFQKSISGFSSKKVRILSKRYRHFTISAFCVRFASPSLRSGSASARILKGNLKSKNNFCPLKRKFAVRSSDKINFINQSFFFRLWRKAKR